MSTCSQPHIILTQMVSANVLTVSFLASIPCFVADHLSTWNDFIDTLSYAHNTKPHIRITFSPFELVLSRPSITFTIKAHPAITRNIPSLQWYIQWMHHSDALMDTSNKKLLQTQFPNKRHSDVRFCKECKHIQRRFQVFSRSRMTKVSGTHDDNVYDIPTPLEILLLFSEYK